MLHSMLTVLLFWAGLSSLGVIVQVFCGGLVWKSSEHEFAGRFESKLYETVVFFLLRMIKKESGPNVGEIVNREGR